MQATSISPRGHLDILIETIQVLVIYPLFVQSARHLIKLRALQLFITRIRLNVSASIVNQFGPSTLFLAILLIVAAPHLPTPYVASHFGSRALTRPAPPQNKVELIRQTAL